MTSAESYNCDWASQIFNSVKILNLKKKNNLAFNFELITKDCEFSSSNCTFDFPVLHKLT